MNNLAIITILFDYPQHYQPTFQNKLLANFAKNDYYIIRYESENETIRQQSLYFKFTYFRIQKFISFIKEHILNKYKYFILLDATDIGYVGNINNIIDIMNYYNCDTLFGAERFLWPNTEYSILYDKKNIPTPYKFLNAGAFCSTPESFIKHIDHILDRQLFGLCDQGNWQIEYLLNNDIQIDYEHKLVLNTFLAKPDIILNTDGVKFVGGPPIFIHDNGPYNDDTIKLLKYFV